jgi:hypothetical protein
MLRLLFRQPMSLFRFRNSGELGLETILRLRGDRLRRDGAHLSPIPGRGIGGGSTGLRTGDTTSPSSRSSRSISALTSMGSSTFRVGTEDGPLCDQVFLVSTGLDEPRIDRGASGGGMDCDCD